VPNTVRTLACLAAAVLLIPACSPAEEGEGEAAAAESPERPRVPALQIDDAAAAWVDETLAAMTLRQRVAQLVFPWLSGQAPSANPQEMARMRQWVTADEVGGFIISTGAPEALAAKLNTAQARSTVPLLVVSDLETGPGMRLRPGGTDMPPSMAFGAARNASLAREAGRVTGIEARAVGIHMTLGPLLDVNVNPANPIINVRSFGEDPALVARLATAWVEGARETGLLSAGKHFPGHGDTYVDSHVGLPRVEADSARLYDVEIAPFRHAVHAGMDGVLVGHIAAVGLEGPDAPPASLSPRMVDGILRNELGFEGLVITDALNMGGVTRHYSVAEASILALLAGADVLLQPPGASGVIDRIVAAVEAGRIPQARIDQAVRRVLAAKAAAGLHDGARVDPARIGTVVGVPAHRELARRVAQNSITLVRDRDLVPVRPGARVLHVTYTAAGRGAAGGTLQRELAAGGLTVEHVRVGGATPAATFASLRQRAAAADLVIVSAAVAPFQYRALGIEGGFPAFVERLAAEGRPVVAVSLGSPYVLDNFPSVPAFMLAWGATAASERAAAQALLGTIPIEGRLPVSLPPYHRMGEGISREARR
jgi:beta-N-acetylhexosaminidase